MKPIVFDKCLFLPFALLALFAFIDGTCLRSFNFGTFLMNFR